MKDHLLPWIKANFDEDDYIVFQQDGAPCHTSKRTQAWLTENLNFWSKELWPPSSPDLNPLDYSIWAYVQDRACQHAHPNENSLKSSIRKAWAQCQHRILRPYVPDFGLVWSRLLRTRVDTLNKCIQDMPNKHGKMKKIFVSFKYFDNITFYGNNVVCRIFFWAIL